MDRMAADPFSGDIKRLETFGWRRRVGNYRVFFDIDMDAHVIRVTAITRHTSSTYSPSRTARKATYALCAL